MNGSIDGPWNTREICPLEARQHPAQCGKEMLGNTEHTDWYVFQSFSCTPSSTPILSLSLSLSLDPLVVTRNGSHPLDKDVSRQPGEEEVDKRENTGNPSGRNYSLFSLGCFFYTCVREGEGQRPRAWALCARLPSLSITVQ